MLAPLGGYRPIGPPADPGEAYRLLSLALGAVSTGFVVKTFADPTLAGGRRVLAPFGTSREAEWSDVTLVSVGVFLAYLEPDPSVPWGRERVEQMAAGIRALEAEAEQESAV